VQEEQIRYADLILLNKVDRLDTNARQRVEINLRKINANAPIVVTEKGQVDPAVLSAHGVRTSAHAAHKHDHDCDCGHEHHDHDHGDHAHHDHDHHAHDHLPHAASTLFLPLPGPVERGVFSRFLGSLPASVFRAKGFIRLTESPDKLHTFQQVRDQAELLLLPLEEGTELATGLVLIGPHLEEDHIRELAKPLLSAPVP
jgi:G3E family GTPase